MFLAHRCACGHCCVMPTQREWICCEEVEEIKELLEDHSTLDEQPPCIIQHTDFANVCLCKAVLTVSLHVHRFHYGTSDVPTDVNM